MKDGLYFLHPEGCSGKAGKECVREAALKFAIHPRFDVRNQVAFVRHNLRGRRIEHAGVAEDGID